MSEEKGGYYVCGIKQLDKTAKSFDIYEEPTIEQLQQENKQLNNILTELEEWTKSEYDRYYNDKENLVFSNVEVIDFGRVLNKIQKLKEKYK